MTKIKHRQANQDGNIHTILTFQDVQDVLGSKPADSLIGREQVLLLRLHPTLYFIHPVDIHTCTQLLMWHCSFSLQFQSETAATTMHTHKHTYTQTQTHTHALKTETKISLPPYEISKPNGAANSQTNDLNHHHLNTVHYKQH